MKVLADLHIHGRYSQATSKDLSIPNLEKYARIKGVNLLGTGDFTHPKWVQELKEHLTEDDTGILKTESGFQFMLQTEISLIYTQGGRGRRIHHVVLSPNLEVCNQITNYLLKFGRVDYDGRPIFKIPSSKFVEDLKAIERKIEVIPAHIWTPWFSMFGSKSGFDSVEECFGDQKKHIFAVETGLSSDPPMNWRIPDLDGLTLVSNSDLHSFWPWRIGREANEFNIKKNELTYNSIINTIKTREGFTKTIEVDPNYGRYHFDGHRNCNICFSPTQTKEHNGICPKCKKPLTIGVQYRVDELAKRPEGYTPKNPIPFAKVIPLSEIISVVLGKAIATKSVWKEYFSLVDPKQDRNEMQVLFEIPEEELLKKTSPKLADAILKNRIGAVKVQPGYDGEYGIPELGGSPLTHEHEYDPKKSNKNHPLPAKKTLTSPPMQKGLNDFL